MSDAFEESALRSLVDQLSAQVTQLSMQVTMMQNNRNDAWVDNIPTHFTPIPMANGGGSGLHPYKLRFRKQPDKSTNLEIYYPPRILSIYNLWRDGSETENISQLEEDDNWYKIEDYHSGFSGYVVLEFKQGHSTESESLVIKCVSELTGSSELISENKEQVAIGKINDGKIQQIISSILILKPLAEWVDPII